MLQESEHILSQCLKHSNGSTYREHRHLQISCLSLLSQEFIVSLLPQGQQLDVAGEEALCADCHLESYRL